MPFWPDIRRKWGGILSRGLALYEDTMNPWRNGSASDSRPEGWGFKSLWVHSFSLLSFFFTSVQNFLFFVSTGARNTASRAPLAERSAVNRQVLGSIPSGGALIFLSSIVFHAFGLLRNWWLHSSSLAVEHRSYEPGVVGSIPTWSILHRSSARSVMVIIGASQALDPGSIPGERKRF